MVLSEIRGMATTRANALQPKAMVHFRAGFRQLRGISGLAGQSAAGVRPQIAANVRRSHWKPVETPVTPLDAVGENPGFGNFQRRLIRWPAFSRSRPTAGPEIPTDFPTVADPKCAFTNPVSKTLPTAR